MGTRYALGWQKDLPDIRDYDPSTPEVAAFFKSAGVKSPASAKAKLPASADLSKWCSPVEDQQNIGSCTAHAGVGLLEYFENRAFGTFVDASHLFLYKVTRNLLGWSGDTGGYLRTAMQAMVLFGVPPERYMPYDTAHFEDEPSAFLYSFAGNFKTIRYYRLDPTGGARADILPRVKSFLAAGYPAMFGFTVYNFGNAKGEFTYPTQSDHVQGGHAVMAVGYDDVRKIGKEKGALKIRNSWGTSWGENGYGWLPYKYVTSGLADDFWSLFKADYVPTGNFK